MRQLIIARKDLNMSPGKLAAQVAHASMAFLTHQMKMNALPQTRLMETPVCTPISEIENPYEILHYNAEIVVDKATYEEWICGSFVKIICEARNRNHLEQALEYAKQFGLLNEGYDYFLIKDNCLTELTPEEIDENGVGRTLTCIGFRPLEDEIAWQISKKFQLYK